MKLKGIIYIAIAFLFSYWSTYAQHDNVWAFGQNAGLDFNGNSPQAIKTSMDSQESCAVYCDENGELLLYSDGTSVWDRNHNLMPNASNLPGLDRNITSSTSQGALILPMPGNADKYYVFSLGMDEDEEYAGHLYYSVVDMTLNNGLGDVLTAERGILLDTLLTEHMTAVNGNNCNIWLLLVSRTDNSFKAYNIDANGIDLNPVLSPGQETKELTKFRDVSGYLTVSHDRSKLALPQQKLLLYDFNPDLGAISNPIQLDFFEFTSSSQEYLYGQAGIFFGVAFSPDNSKLYVSMDFTQWGYQFDLSSGDPLTMANSKTIIFNSARIFAMKTGPDGKIYCASHDNDQMSIIHKPNLPGIDCEYTKHSFPLLEGTKAKFALPNSPVIVTKREFYSSRTDTVVCTTEFSLEATHSYGNDYLWNDGVTGSSRLVSQSGAYWVSYYSDTNCILNAYVDTFNIFFDMSRETIHTETFDTGFCKADTLTLKAVKTSGADYIWDDGSREIERKLNKPGSYWVRYKIDDVCKDYVDSIHITYEDYRVSFVTDSFACINNTVNFQNTSDPKFQDFRWFLDGQQISTMNDDLEHSFHQEGSYEFMLTAHINDACVDTAYKNITVDPVIPINFLVDKDSICIGESIVFAHQLNDNSISSLQWQFDEHITMFAHENRIQHAFDASGRTEVELTAKFRACPESSFTDTVYVFDLPKVDLGTDNSLCLNGEPIILRNLQSRASTQQYLWNTGDTTETLKVTGPGLYSLTVGEQPLACSTTEFIEISKSCYLDIPNAFTPNADGENDYFLPRQLLSKNLTHFRMQVFNRWGQIMFETNAINGRGWDGRFNGKDQDQGVYIYNIEVEFEGYTERYQGNVTLLR